MTSFLAKYGTSIAFGLAGLAYGVHAAGMIDDSTLNWCLTAIGTLTGVVIGGSKIGEPMPRRFP